MTALLAVLLTALPAPQTTAAQEHPQLQAEAHVTGLKNPWGMDFLGPDTLLVTLQEGRLLRFDRGNAEGPDDQGSPWKRTVISGLPPVVPAGQGGLLDVAVGPEGWIYWSYSDRRKGGYGTRLARGKLEGSEMTRVEELFSLAPNTPTTRHFGSRIAFDPAGFLYLSVGDRGNRDRAQNPADPAGSVLRFSPSGQPAGSPRAPDNAHPALFSWGHRNIQGLAWRPSREPPSGKTGKNPSREEGDIWAHEHGPQGGDEINNLLGGVNYGWPRATYGREYGSGDPIGQTAVPGTRQPLLHWTPSIAPSGLAVLDASDPALLRALDAQPGDLLAGALAGRHLRLVRLEDHRPAGQEILLQDQLGRIRDVIQGPRGNLYLITDADQGALYRLRPSAAP